MSEKNAERAPTEGLLAPMVPLCEARAHESSADMAVVPIQHHGGTASIAEGPWPQASDPAVHDALRVLRRAQRRLEDLHDADAPAHALRVARAHVADTRLTYERVLETTTGNSVESSAS